MNIKHTPLLYHFLVTSIS